MVRVEKEQLLHYIMEQKNRVLFHFANQCAPVVLASKPAILLMIPEVEKKQYEEEARRWKIEMVTLCHRQERSAVLFFHPQRLSQRLQKVDTKDYLEHRGYGQMGLDAVFMELGRRMQSFYEKRSEYPHELGLLLGYPLEDVIGYVANHGQGCLLSGYWKVYHDVALARQTFEEYDQARNAMLALIL